METNNKSYFNELTKEETLLLKGIAIILMVGYHLFCFPERLNKVEYISLIPINFATKTVENFIFSQGKICVAIFLFLSGYGMYRTYNTKKNETIWKFCISRVKKFYINYWIVFFIFIPVGYFFVNFDLKSNLTLIKNIFILDTSYNGEWWFAKYYIMMLILFPIINKAINKNLKLTLVIVAILCFTYKLHLTKLFIWQFPFVLGMIFSKSEIYSKIRRVLIKIRHNNLLGILGILVILFLRIITGEYLNIFTDYGLDGIFVPIIISFIIILKIPKWLGNLLQILGKHSGNIWLTHTFFAYYYFQQIVFYPKLSIFVISWNFILSMLSSIIIFKIAEKISKIQNKVGRQNVS